MELNVCLFVICILKDIYKYSSSPILVKSKNTLFLFTMAARSKNVLLTG